MGESLESGVGRILQVISVGAVAVSESQQTWCMPAWRSPAARQRHPGDGVYKSADGGRTGRTRPGAKHGRQPAAGSSRQPASSTRPCWAIPTARAQKRHLQSIDGGKSWQNVPSATSRPRRRLVDGSGNPDVLYADLGVFVRRIAVERRAGSGLFKTTTAVRLDGADEGERPPAPLWGKWRFGFGADASRSTRLSKPPTAASFFERRRRHLTRVTRSTMRQRAFYYTRIYADPKARDPVDISTPDLPFDR